MQRNSRKRSSHTDSLLDLPPSDPLLETMKSVTADTQFGDLPLEDQAIFYNPNTRTFTIPPMPLAKQHFQHLFGECQNRTTAARRAIEETCKCRLVGDFRVRTVKVIASNKEDAVTAWGKVLDECCRLPSLRPKRYTVVHYQNHSVIASPTVAEVNPQSQIPLYGHVIPDLPDIAFNYIARHKVLTQLQDSLRGVGDVVIDQRKRLIRITSSTPEQLAIAKEVCISTVKTTQELVQPLYLSVPIPLEFAELLQHFIDEQSGISVDDLYAYILLGEVVCSSDLPQVMVGLIPKIHPLTGAAAVSISLNSFAYSGKRKKVDSMRFDLAEAETVAQVVRLQRTVFDELEKVKESGRASAQKPTLHVGATAHRKLTLSPCSFPAPDTLYSYTVCVGRPGDLAGIELSLV